MGAGHSHSHGHSHGDGDGYEATWSAWMGFPALRLILVVLGLAVGATIVGMIALWPDGSGRETALEESRFLGLSPDIYPAVIEDTFDDTCSYGTSDDPRQCRFYTFIPDEGPEAGAILFLPEYDLDAVSPDPGLAPGDRIFVAREPRTDFYFFRDRDRGNTLVWLALAFAVVVVAMGRVKGLMALVSMALTVAVLVGFVAPSVLDGNDPLLVALVAGSTIAFVSLYLTHGFNPITTVALTGTLASLVLTLLLSTVFFRASQFTGLATEAGLTLPLLADIDLSSLLLSGAMIGALGALDDITVTQAATVAELRFRNDRLTVAQLTTSGIRVGRDHIASIVNTLLLAYAGASMPLLLLFAASDQSLSSVANSELVAVEIVRTLCGSIGLVAAVPVTTFLAAVLVGAGSTDDDIDGKPNTDGPASHAHPGDQADAGGHQHPIHDDEPIGPGSQNSDRHDAGGLDDKPPMAPPTADGKLDDDEEPPASPSTASWDDFAPTETTFDD